MCLSISDAIGRRQALTFSQQPVFPEPLPTMCTWASIGLASEKLPLDPSPPEFAVMPSLINSERQNLHHVLWLLSSLDPNLSCHFASTCHNWRLGDSGRSVKVARVLAA